MNEVRKLKREELIMKRRGLNFISDTVADTLNDDSVAAIELETDNVAPKVVGILALNPSSDVKALRSEMVKYCLEYQ
jgi:hypothetical protein